MAQVGSTVTKALAAILASGNGVSAALSVIADLTGIQLQEFTTDQIIIQNVAPEVVERSTAMRYPTVLVYCAKVTNTLREKFRTFSGEAEMMIEVRASQDRLEGLENSVQLYCDAVTRVLDKNRGTWGAGINYCGGYEVVFGQVKHGGRNFLQSAKIRFTVDVSRN